jgi:hypothetical protein
MGLGFSNHKRKRAWGPAAAGPGRRSGLGVECLETRDVPTIVVTPMVSPQTLVQNLLGPGVTASNIKFTGAPVAEGTFTQGTDAVGFDSGIILSTGKAGDVVPPESFFASTDNGQPGDPQLSAVVGGAPGFDAAELEFDFVPNGSTLTFQYTFGSEEYPNFAPPNTSTFNDVFAFFLNGTNIATLPDGTPVSVNSVNAVTNTQFFVNNSANGMDMGPQIANTSLDGLTIVLTATAKVNPGVTNHIKLAIEDTGDGIFDSDVFIKAGSFNAAKPFQPRVFAPFRWIFDPTTDTYRGNLTLFNNDTAPGLGPIQLVFPKALLPTGFDILNATGTSKSGDRFITVNFQPVPPMRVVRVQLIVSDPLSLPLPTFFDGFPVVAVPGSTPP